jgi:paraquat-inducible protein B
LVEAESFEVLVRVFFEVVEGAVETIGHADLTGHAAVARFVEKGLRAQLKSQSLITGKLYIDLDLHPGTEIVYQELELATDAIEMPTVPTTLEAFERQARAVVERISEMPLEDLVERLASAASGLDALVNDPKLAGAIARLEGTLAGTERLAEELDGRLDELATETGATLEEIRSAAASLDTMVAQGSPLQYQLITTLEELEVAARSLRLLADNLSRQPEQLIFGKPTEGVRE